MRPSEPLAAYLASVTAQWPYLWKKLGKK